MRKTFVLAAILIAVTAICWLIAAASPQEEVKSRAYVGHENDRDVRNFAGTIPEKAAGTRLDDCQTCHRSGVPGPIRRANSARAVTAICFSIGTPGTRPGSRRALRTR